MGPLAALRAAHAEGLLPTGVTLLVACSGGRDSMALCHALRSLDRWTLVVATVDHGLRAGSADDAAFVAETASRWALPCIVARPDVPAPRNGGAQGPEDAARRARHAALEDARTRAGATSIVYAHTADDQWETLMMRLACGAGLSGLAGMRRAGGRRVRPWLDVSRAEVAQYATDERVPWRDDPSNADPRFLRNQVRQVLRPAAERVFGPHVATAAQRTSQTLSLQAAALDELLAGQRDRWVRGVEHLPDGAVVYTLDATALRTCSRALRRTAVHHLMRELHELAGEAPPRSMAGRTDRICAALEAGGSRGVGGRDGFTMTQGRGLAVWRLGPKPGRPG